MLRKFAIAAVTVATVATAAVTVMPSAAEAKNRNRAGAVAAGAIIGLAAGAIIASQAQPRYYAPVRCYNKPIQRWDPYYRQYVVVGYRQVCH
ncbi:MAG: tyrosyl-tRNA synthetase [Roseibium sp.]|uniref:tyrosyl-tRNA synthetase n=1 Tax=Roseibium sp. TaxID=1936156 RepID=UPI002633A5EE|nr:tyrosyl-tRNA synthetase [Roseibium sp.]MCV0428105.1 tyrosyl-tRNA synthetase [Roseibium sp.]